MIALIVSLLALAASGLLWYRGKQRLSAVDNQVSSVQSGLQDQIKNGIKNRIKQQVMPKLGQLNSQVNQLHSQANQFNSQVQQLHSQVHQFNGQLNQFTGQQNQLKAQVNQVKGQVQKLTGQAQDLSQSLSQHEQRISQLKQSLANVQSQNKRLSNRLGGNHEFFVEQRIALLLEAANQRLQIQRDPNGARRALKLADQAIARAGDPQLNPVRAKIANEIAKLKALPNPDIEGLSLKLSNLIGRVSKLPLASNVPSNYQPNTASAGPNSGDSAGKAESQHQGTEFAGIALAKKWHHFLNSIGTALSQMVTVRRASGTENAPALMAPKQAFFLVQNLQLQLRIARLALLDGNGKSYHSAISEAKTWLRRYFDTSNSKVAAALNTLDKLSKTTVEWQAPDISASLDSLRQIMSKNHAQSAGGKHKADHQAAGQTAGSS